MIKKEDEKKVTSEHQNGAIKDDIETDDLKKKRKKQA